MNSELIDKIGQSKEDKPSIGMERENLCVWRDKFSQVDRLDGGQSPLEAVRDVLNTQLQPGEKVLTASYVEELTKSVIEVNGEPVRSPRAAAMSVRLLSYITDRALQLIDKDIMPLHGATWQPINTDANPDCITESAGRYKWAYFSYILQGRDYGNRYASACGDHFNISAPWLPAAEMDARTIETSGRLRFLSALFVPFTSSSPIGFDSAPMNAPGEALRYHTTMCPYDSARMGMVWPARAEMDVSGIYRAAYFRSTLMKFADRSQLMSGGDIHLPVRPQAAPHAAQSFEAFCKAEGIVFDDIETMKYLLFLCFRHGSHLPRQRRADLQERGLLDTWNRIEAWRRNIIHQFIAAERNRIEIRTLEAPFSFADQSGYQYEKALYTFLELLFICACEDESALAGLSMAEEQLAAAQQNERKAERYGLDGVIHWTPDMHSFSTTRDALQQRVLPMLDDVAKALGGGRDEDLELIREIIHGSRETPSRRLRREILDHYGVKADELDGNAHFPITDSGLLQGLLDRNRSLLSTELAQIKNDISTALSGDRPYLDRLVRTAEQLDTALQNRG